MARKPGRHQKPFVLQQRRGAQEHREQLNAQLSEHRRGRTMAEFSEAELALLLVKVTRWKQDGTCRVSPYRAMTAVGEG